MIFYGKASRRIALSAALDEVEAWIAEAEGAEASPVARHGAWTSALVAAGGLAQGLADAGCQAGEAAALDLATRLAAVMGASLESGFAARPAPRPAAVAEALAALRLLPALPGTLDLRRPEGFAHYAVYPEAYWRAARDLPGPSPTRVLGIRSIGSCLAPCVAAALGAAPAVTLRPEGHPFARTAALPETGDLAPRDGADETWAVVDEGPGLSGSSIGAAAEALARRGVPAERLVLFPSHGGAPGPMAKPAHRELWSSARLALCPFDDLWRDPSAPGPGLAGWFEDITGPLLEPLVDMAGGAWRRYRFRDAACWPAVDRQNERRKFLVTGRNGRFLLRFTGLGSFGRAKFDRALALAEAGFGLAPLGWRHGFLVEAWRDDLAPLAPAGADRPVLLRRLGAYLAFRARRFPATPEDGASLEALFAMARVNTAEALGEEAAHALAPWAQRLPRLAPAVRPVATDGRLAAHEWLGRPDGPPVKTDALDHCCGHDLVGCQDIAWDVAGAAAELALSEAEVAELCRTIVAAGGPACDPGLLAFLRIAYPAFRIGALTMARDREAGAEAERLSEALAPQAAALCRALA